MSDKRHNGWTNHATWQVHLWLSSYESEYYWARALVAESLRPASALRDAVHHRVLEAAEGDAPMNGLACDLLSAALADVNWSEVAEAFSGENEDENEDDPPRAFKLPEGGFLCSDCAEREPRAFAARVDPDAYPDGASCIVCADEVG